MEGQELDERLAKLKLALDAVRKRFRELEDEKSKLQQQELFIMGQIQEREYDKPQGVELPIYDSKEKLEKALANQGKDVFGRSPEETGESRQALMEKEAEGTVDYLHKAQTEQSAESE